MADWTTIPDSSLEPGKPIRAIDGLALRDNPIAIAEGAVGAPRIVDGALSTTATNTGRDWVLNRTALAAVGAVGTYAWLAEVVSTVTTNPGGTRAGSALRYAGFSFPAAGTDDDMGAAQGVGNGGTPTGTWRAMGRSLGNGVRVPVTLWLRIS